MRDVLVAYAGRTPIGKFLGSFQSESAPALQARVVADLLRRTGVPAARVDEALFGCARQAGLGPNPARQAAIRGGLPVEVPAATLNMACGSGLLAIIEAARRIRGGEAELVLAGGMENMTRVPFLLPKARLGYRMGHQPMVDAMYQDGFLCPMAEQVMGETAETLARDYEISREEQDAFAARSQNRAEAAIAEGRFADELVPVVLTDRRGRETAIEADEHPRAGVSAASLAKLPPVFSKEGSVTAGNSSGITDGAAALLLASPEAVREFDLEPLCVLEGWTAAGVDPARMGLGPVPAVKKLTEKLGRGLDSFDLVELNEAFAAQVIACDRELELDAERLNVNGGSIALGHPIGCTGARITVTLAHELRRRGGGHGLATLCISGGQGLALALRTPDARSR